MNTFYQPECILGDMDNIHSTNGNVDLGDKLVCVAASEGEGQNLNAGSLRLSPPSVVMETSKATAAKAEPANSALPSGQASPSPVPERLEDQNNNGQRRSSPSHSSVSHVSPSPSPSTQTPLTKVFITQNRQQQMEINSPVFCFLSTNRKKTNDTFMHPVVIPLCQSCCRGACLLILSGISVKTSTRLSVCAAGEANQPEEAVIRANRPRPESQV